jgi:hypothetical protein
VQHDPPEWSTLCLHDLPGVLNVSVAFEISLIQAIVGRQRLTPASVTWYVHLAMGSNLKKAE